MEPLIGEHGMQWDHMKGRGLIRIEGQPIFHEVVNFMAQRGYLVYASVGFLRRPYDGALR
jgi:hypothetical protein